MHALRRVELAAVRRDQADGPHVFSQRAGQSVDCLRVTLNDGVRRGRDFHRAVAHDHDVARVLRLGDIRVIERGKRRILWRIRRFLRRGLRVAILIFRKRLFRSCHITRNIRIAGALLRG